MKIGPRLKREFLPLFETLILLYERICVNVRTIMRSAHVFCGYKNKSNSVCLDKKILSDFMFWILFMLTDWYCLKKKNDKPTEILNDRKKYIDKSKQ